MTSLLMRLGLEALLNRALEEERTDFLGRERYERTGLPADAAERTGYRNRYKPGHVDTAEGRVELALPQVRTSTEPFQAQTLAAVRGRSHELDRLVVELYARGLSTRDIEDTFRDQETGACTLYRTAFSQITEALWQEYEAFQQRDLAEVPVLYVFLDAVFEPLHRQGRTREGALCAWGICEDGRKALLHLALGNTESYESWRDFLRDLVARGPPTALRTHHRWRARPLAGRRRGVVQEPAHPLLGPQCAQYPEHGPRGGAGRGQSLPPAFLEAICDAPTPEAGRQAAADAVERYTDLYPSAMRSFNEDLEASLAHLELPLVHRKYVRTTNLIERSFEEERRRTKILPRFWSEHSGLKLMFAVLWRASARRQRVRITALERKQLELVRQRLGLTPDPTPGRTAPPAQEASAWSPDCLTFTESSGLDWSRSEACSHESIQVILGKFCGAQGR